MMVSNIFRPLYVIFTFAHNNHCYQHYFYHDILELDLASREKNHNFSNSVKWNI